ncbi:MAG: deoxyribodipyrimidine photo-lyase, partial [Methylophilaceae bacterium]|nr:deoxyribodipyrimidine photo-lyase [Methylophilaceae bacterium]
MLNIVWFKRDLRIENHTALAKAMHQGPILALYCWEPSQWLADDASLSQQAFIGECLRSLRQSLQTLQIPLQISSLGIIAT